MTFKEYLDGGTLKLDLLFETLKTSLSGSVVGGEYDNSINVILKDIIEEYVFKRYYNFVLLFPVEYIDRQLPSIIINKFNNIVMCLRQLQLTSSDYYKNLSNWSYKSESSGENSFGYSGYDANGTFNNNKSNNKASNGDKFTYLLQMNSPLISTIDVLCGDLEKLFKTIY